MMSERRPLSQRRKNVSFDYAHEWERGAEFPYRCSIGYFDDDTIGEVFLNSAKHDTPLDANIRDAAILISIALQHGAPFETLLTSMALDHENYPASPIGMCLKEIVKHGLATYPSNWTEPVQNMKVVSPTMTASQELASLRRAEAKAKGYESEACRTCGNFTMLRNGTCLKCNTCGETSGCS